MNSGTRRSHIDGLIFNAPFLDFNQTKFEKSISYFVAKVRSKLFPYSKIDGALYPAYAQINHKGFYGEWNFNKDWKPIKVFPAFLKWVVPIAEAQKKLADSNITVPILILQS
jgi:alpha-beta hydrolase superfamily lysophospholipase